MAMRTVEKEAEFDDIDNVELIVVLNNPENPPFTPNQNP